LKAGDTVITSGVALKNETPVKVIK
jgi:hypothetical protein